MRPTQPNLTTSQSILHELYDFNRSKAVATITAINFLGYYAMLGIYAIVNLIQMARGLNFSPVAQVITAICLASCAILNEYYDQVVTCEKETYDDVDSKSVQSIPVQQQIVNLPTYLAFSAVASCLATGDLLIRTYNMVWLQLQNFRLHPMVEKGYYSIFIGSAVLGFGLNYVNTFVKYIVHVLMPGYQAQYLTDSSASNGKNQEVDLLPATEINNTAASTPNISAAYASRPTHKVETAGIFAINILLRSSVKSFISNSMWALYKLHIQYLISPQVTFVGASIGSLLYALGDFSQMYGLMSHVPQNIVAITPVWHLSLSLIFACNTVLERNMIWGYNFQQYAKTLDANTSTNIFDKVKANTFIKLIDFKPATRRLLANIRLGGVLLLNILGACLHLRGHYRYLGIATSMGYFAAQTTQVYFQARKANDVKQVQQPELNALDDNRIENQNKRQQTEKYGKSGPNR